ncbi:MAG: MFS transporter [Actinomycetota bacterium]
MTTTAAPPSSDAPVPDAPQGFRKWVPLLVMGLAIFIVVLDTTLLNVSLATIVRELDTDIRSIQWVISGYSLTLAALTITGGRMGDMFGRKRMFVAGAGLFAAGSFLASVSPNVAVLILGEAVIEGIGAALMLPATASLLITTYRGSDRALALGVWGGMAALGAGIGPVVGGYLTSNYSWRWGFRINVFVAAVLIGASFLIRDERERSRPQLDWFGALLSGTGLFMGVFTLIEGPVYGWRTAVDELTLFGFGLSPAGLSVVPFTALLSFGLQTGFVLWERRVTRRGRLPLVSVKLFSIAQFRNGATLTGLMALGQVGLLFGLPVFLQGVTGLDAQATGIALLPMSIGLLIMAPFGGYLSRHVPPKRIVLTGLGFAVTGLGLMYNMLSVETTAGDFLVPLGFYGIGVGLCLSQLANITLSAVDPRDSGQASGVNSTVRQIGASLGTAILGTIVVASIASGLHAGILASPELDERQRTVVAQEASGQVSEIEFGGRLETSESLSAAQHAEIRRIAQQATVDANKRAYLFTICTTLLAVLLATRLPRGLNVERNESLQPVAAATR